MSEKVKQETIDRMIEALSGEGIGGIRSDQGDPIFDSGSLWFALVTAKRSLGGERIGSQEEIRFHIAASSEREARIKLAIEYPEYAIAKLSPLSDLCEVS